jgi:alpha-L-fucosidase
MKTKFLGILFMAFSISVSFQTVTGQEKHSDNSKQLEKIQTDFLKLKFGMFISYNMATYKNVEWVEGYPSPADFNPRVETIDTDAWADAAAAAGMNYGVLTVKHVSGFCLWDSKHTTYDVMHPDCPYKKDIVAQFIKSFKSRGLKVGIYYCWRHPSFGDPGKYKVLPPECDPSTHGMDEQIKFQKAQIAELLERYPDVCYVWNDALDPEIMSSEKLMDFYGNIAPRVLASANWFDWAKKGAPFAHIAVTEQIEFPEQNTFPGETCWTLEDAWFWKNGTKTKRAADIIPLISNANSRTANFLLNVGPDLNGKLTQSSIETLKEIGKLRKKNKDGVQ